MIAAILTIAMLLVLTLVVFLIGSRQLERPDYKRIDEVEREVELGPPYTSELPKIKPFDQDQIW